jgi:hypothetical protein
VKEALRQVFIKKQRYSEYSSELNRKESVSSEQKKGLRNLYPIHYRINMINEIYVFWSYYCPIQYAKRKKPLENGHNSKTDDFSKLT